MSKTKCTEEEKKKGKKTWNSDRGNFCVDQEQYDLWNRMKEGANRVEEMRSEFETAKRQLARLAEIEKTLTKSVSDQKEKVKKLSVRVNQGKDTEAQLNRENKRLTQLEGTQEKVKEELKRAKLELAKKNTAIEQLTSENEKLETEVKTIIDETKEVSNKLLDKIKPFFTFSKETCSENFENCEEGQLCLIKGNKVGICHQAQSSNKSCCTMKQYMSYMKNKFEFHNENEANKIFTSINNAVENKQFHLLNNLINNLNSQINRKQINSQRNRKQSRRRSTRRKRRRSKSRKRRKKRGSRSRKRRRRVSRKRSKRGRKRSRKRSKRK